MRRLAVVLVLMLTACGGDDGDSTTDPADTTAPTASQADPYETFLRNGGQAVLDAEGITLSREDAQTRALLGCDQTWAPGTIDALLQAAYADLC